MADEDLMAVTARLTTAAEAAAALAAKIKLDLDGGTADARVRAVLGRVVEAVCDPAVVEAADEGRRRTVVGTVTTFLRQALDLIENPSRPPGWSYTDPVVLQAQGQASTVVPPLIAEVAPTLDGLEAALAREGARILDVGSGVAALAIACCRVFPSASVVGLDPWEPSQALARVNVEAAGLSDRITLRTARLEELNEPAAFDLVWVPTLFLSPDVLDAAIACAADCLRDGAWIVLGLYAGTGDALASALVDLRTVRGGGTPMTDDDAVALLERSGLTDAHVVERTWAAPIRFVVGRR